MSLTLSLHVYFFQALAILKVLTYVLETPDPVVADVQSVKKLQMIKTVNVGDYVLL